MTPPAAPTTPPKQQREEDYGDFRSQAFRSRTAPSSRDSQYEGSLWKDEASWGNLLRDHRARFAGDLVKIVTIQDMISIPKKEEPQPVTPIVEAAQQGEEQAARINQALDVLTGEEQAEEEQNEVLQSLRSISAYVKTVLPNGNMLIVGEKVDYRQQNTVRYVTTIKGIIRPSDVNDSNEVPALKLARFEAKIKRQMLAKNLNTLAPIIGAEKAGLLDRLSHLATIPASDSQTTTVNQQ